jgi:hypothetical protein
MAGGGVGDGAALSTGLKGMVAVLLVVLGSVPVKLVMVAVLLMASGLVRVMVRVRVMLLVGVTVPMVQMPVVGL